eukprot:6961052-Prymnesium_polylepis.3
MTEICECPQRLPLRNFITRAEESVEHDANLALTQAVSCRITATIGQEGELIREIHRGHIGCADS